MVSEMEEQDGIAERIVKIARILIPKAIGY